MPCNCYIICNFRFYGQNTRSLCGVNNKNNGGTFEAPKKLTMLLAGKEDCKCAIVNILDAEVVGGGAGDDLNEGEKGAYLKTKCELLEYTRKAACLFAQTLRVNAVAPGAVLAPVAVHEKAGETLLDRRPTAADVADAVAYLLAAESVTGAIIPVDSGQHLIQG
mgnify:CR=1 FL=1